MTTRSLTAPLLAALLALAGCPDVAGDDDSATPDDDDSAAVPDDDDSSGADDDDSSSQDDDDSVVADDDDSVIADDDDSAVDDDDSAVDDDDSAALPETCSPEWILGCGAIGSDSHNNGDTGSTDAIDSWACDPALSMTGPEYLYEFMAPVPATYTVELTGMTADLDLFVLDAAGGDCEVAPCLAHAASAGAADESLTFVATTDGQLFYLAVDGYQGATSDYTIEVSCPECSTDWPLNCVESADTWTNGIGATNTWEDYACTAYADEETGPEYVYVFNAEADGTVTVDLTGLTADLDLFVLAADASGGCDPAECQANSSSTADESITWSVLAGETWYIVVDGFQGATSGWTITLSCS